MLVKRMNYLLYVCCFRIVNNLALKYLGTRRLKTSKLQAKEVNQWVVTEIRQFSEILLILKCVNLLLFPLPLKSISQATNDCCETDNKRLCGFWTSWCPWKLNPHKKVIGLNVENLKYNRVVVIIIVPECEYHLVNLLISQDSLITYSDTLGSLKLIYGSLPQCWKFFEGLTYHPGIMDHIAREPRGRLSPYNEATLHCFVDLRLFLFSPSGWHSHWFCQVYGFPRESWQTKGS